MHIPHGTDVVSLPLVQKSSKKFYNLFNGLCPYWC